MTAQDVARQDVKETADPVRHAVAVDVSSADQSLSYVSTAIWVGTSGDLKVDMEDVGTGITFASASGWMPIRVTKIYTSGTTASGIVAVW